MAGLLELRTDARLLVANLLQRGLDTAHRLLVAEQLAEILETRLCHLGLHLRHTEVVGLSHEEGDESVQFVVLRLQLLMVVQDEGHDDGLVHLFRMVHSHRRTLQPHHAPEVALQLLGAGVVATRTEQAVGELDVARIVHQQLADVVLGLHHAFYLPHLQRLVVAVLDGLTREQVPGYVVEHDVAIGSKREVAVGGRSLKDVAHSQKHLVREVGHQLHKVLLLQFAQHTVEVEVIELEEEVGGDERGEALVVVLLVDVEQLFVAGRDDGEARMGQLLAEQRVELLKLCGVREILHVHTQWFLDVEVALQQFTLALLQSFHEGLLLGGELQLTVAHAVVDVAPGLAGLLFVVLEGQALVKLPRQ